MVFVSLSPSLAAWSEGADSEGDELLSCLIAGPAAVLDSQKTAVIKTPAVSPMSTDREGLAKSHFLALSIEEMNRPHKEPNLELNHPPKTLPNQHY